MSEQMENMYLVLSNWPNSWNSYKDSCSYVFFPFIQIYSITKNMFHQRHYAKAGHDRLLYPILHHTQTRKLSNLIVVPLF